MGGQYADILDLFREQGYWEFKDGSGQLVERVECPSPRFLSRYPEESRTWIVRGALDPAFHRHYPYYED